MSRIAVIAAMPAELKPLVRGWRRQTRGGAVLWRHGNGLWIAACAGAGQDAARRAFAEVEREGPVDAVVSTGWAGAISGELEVGKAYAVSGVIDARTGERFAVAGVAGECRLATSDRVADAAQKRRLGAAYGARLVDMEAASVARLAAARNIPFYCVKGVSDGPAERLPDFNRFISPGGKFQLARFILFAIVRPWHWHGLMRMGEYSRRSARGIRDSVLDILERSLL